MSMAEAGGIDQGGEPVALVSRSGEVDLPDGRPEFGADPVPGQEAAPVPATVAESEPLVPEPLVQMEDGESLPGFEDTDLQAGEVAEDQGDPSAAPMTDLSPEDPTDPRVWKARAAGIQSSKDREIQELRKQNAELASAVHQAVRNSSSAADGGEQDAGFVGAEGAVAGPSTPTGSISPPASVVAKLKERYGDEEANDLVAMMREVGTAAAQQATVGVQSMVSSMALTQAPALFEQWVAWLRNRYPDNEQVITIFGQSYDGLSDQEKLDPNSVKLLARDVDDDAEEHGEKYNDPRFVPRIGQQRVAAAPTYDSRTAGQRPATSRPAGVEGGAGAIRPDESTQRALRHFDQLKKSRV